MVWILLLALGCGERSRAPGRVLLIGIDGASPRFTAELIDEGLLPNLGEFARAGVSGTLRSRLPLLSPRIWNSIATGKSPEEHGITGWVRRDREGNLRLFRSSDRKVHALWNIASSSGLSVGIVNWLNTYPPEVVRGAMISDFAIPGEREAREHLGGMFAKRMGGGGQLAEDPAPQSSGTTYPPEWAERLSGLAEGSRTGDVEDPSEGFPQGPVRAVFQSAAPRDRLAVEAALEVEHALSPDLLMVLLLGIDRVSHFLWWAVEPAEGYPPGFQPPFDRESALAGLRKYYAYTDALLGKLLRGHGPRDLVIIVSDHGFATHDRGDGGMAWGHETTAAVEGVLFARGPFVPAGRTVTGVSIEDVTPTVLAWLRLPVGRDMDGRPAPFLEVAAPEAISTYDTSPVQRVEGGGEEMEPALIEELRQLGYVE